MRISDWSSDVCSSDLPAIDRLVPALKGVTLGDGALSSWHGGGPCDTGRIERAITATGVLARPLKHGSEWGFQRLTGGKTVVVCDVGPPPPARLSRTGHASTLPFELADGQQRLVVNSGGDIGSPRRDRKGVGRGKRGPRRV